MKIRKQVTVCCASANIRYFLNKRMGNRTSTNKADIDNAPKISDELKSRISLVDSKKQWAKPLVQEHTPSLKPSALKKEIETAKSISGHDFAPQPTCIEFSIFGPGVAGVWGGNETVLNFSVSQYSDNKDLNSCLGSLYGMLVGDSWGHPLEFVPVQYEKIIMEALDETNFKAPGVCNKFGLKVGQYTDDSSMGLCLADTLLTHGHVDCSDLRKRFVMWWYLGYNNAFRHDHVSRKNNLRLGRSVGLGGQISYSLHKFIESQKEDFIDGADDMSGNGSIMRLCPLPIFYRDAPLDLLVSESMKQSFATHSGVHSAECAAVLSFVIVAAINSQCASGKKFLDELDFTPIMEFLVTDVVKYIAKSQQNTDWKDDKYNKLPEDQSWDWKDPGHRYSPTRSAINPGYVGGYACDNLAMALHCVYNTNTCESAVLRCINRCGDADTVGSVTGQIAGALYGLTDIPESALKCIFKWDPDAEIPHRIFTMFGIGK